MNGAFPGKSGRPKLLWPWRLTSHASIFISRRGNSKREVLLVETRILCDRSFRVRCVVVDVMACGYSQREVFDMRQYNVKVNYSNT